MSLSSTTPSNFKIDTEVFADLLTFNASQKLKEGDKLFIEKCEFTIRNFLLRQVQESSDTQTQTGNLFNYFWQKMEEAGFGIENNSYIKSDRDRLDTLYPNRDVLLRSMLETISQPYVLDAGCGNAQTGMLFFENILYQMKYVAVDISESIDVAYQKLSKNKVINLCIQCDLNKIPIKHNSIDIILCPHVLQHTDCISSSVKSLFNYLKKGGIGFFYCTKPPKPLRQLSDKFLRGKFSEMRPEEAFNQLAALTKLGQSLTSIKEELCIEEDIQLLGIKAGRYPLQTFIFDYLLRAYFRPELPYLVNKAFNLDWFGPKNYHGVSGKDFQNICRNVGFKIIQYSEQFSSSTVIVKK